MTDTGLEAQLAAMRTGLTQIRKELEAAIDLVLPASPGLFQPGHLYALHHARFDCVIVTTDPNTGDPVAWGWSTHNITGKAPWTHRPMNRRTYQQWLDAGAHDLTLGTPLGEQA